MLLLSDGSRVIDSADRCVKNITHTKLAGYLSPCGRKYLGAFQQTFKT